MVSISVFKRKYNLANGAQKELKNFYAQIRFDEPDATYIRSTGSAIKRKALEIAQRFAREIEESELPLRGKPIFTLEGMFSQWITEYGKDLRSGKDLKWQVALLLKIMGGETPINSIGNKSVHDFVLKAKEMGKSEVVINRCLERLRATLGYAARKWEAPINNRIDWKDHRGEEPDEKVMYISPAEARRFVDVLPPHISLAFAFSYYTGCRLDELATLTWDRVSIDERVALVVTKGRGKKVKYRQLRLSNNALNVLRVVGAMPKPPLKNRARRREPDTNTVFFLENRRKHWERARRIVGRPDVVWHGIRHSFGTETSRRAKASDKLIGKMLGHAPGSSATQRYIHAMADDVYEALSLLPDIGMPNVLAQEVELAQLTIPANNGEQKLLPQI